MKNLNKILAIILAIAVCFTTIPVSASVTTTGSYVTVEVAAQQFSSSYTAYDTEREAKEHPITIYVAEDEFPVNAKLVGKNGHNMVYKFGGYGTKRLEVEDENGLALLLTTAASFGLATPFALLNLPKRYAYIDIKPMSEAPSEADDSTSEWGASSGVNDLSPEKTAEALLDEKWQTLLDAADFPFSDSSTYAEELKKLLSEEWDGSEKTADQWGGYEATRYVRNRTYHWLGTDLITGERYRLSVNIDYVGESEVIPGVTADQKFSLAVNRSTGVIEQWSLLDKYDFWTLDEVARGNERITRILPMSADDTEGNCYGYVSTIGKDGNSYSYQLLPFGRVIKHLA